VAESTLATVSITVEPVNDAPAASDDVYGTKEDETLVVDAAAGPLSNDADVDGDPLAAVLVDGPANGTLTLTDDGSFQYTPNADFHGPDGFSYLASDAVADSTLATVSIEVKRVELAVTLEVSGAAFGPDAGGSWAGSTFWVNAYVQDLRDVPQGVVGGSIDVLYDSLVVASTGSVAYGEGFTAFQQGAADDAAGRIDESGALATATGVGANAPAPFIAWQFVRAGAESGSAANAHVQFAVERGDGTATITPANFALAGSADPVDWALAELGTVDLDLSYGDLTGDEVANHFDLAVWLPHSGSVLGDPGYQPTCDLNADGQIDQADLDVLISGMYQPVPSSPLVPEAPAGDGGADDGLTDPSSPTLPAEDQLAQDVQLQAVDELLADGSGGWDALL
ncbi:MAG: Ig-like domain-containing protein, partial [Planctomycetota bacterium]|jgi:hypothetical protein